MAYVWGYLGAVILALYVLVFGGAHPALALAGQGAVALVALGLLATGARTRLAVPPVLALGVGGLAAALLWGWAQTLPLWQAAAHPMYGSMGPLANLFPSPIALNPTAYWPTLSTALAVLLSFAITFAVGQKRPEATLKTLAAIGLAGAVYALANSLVSPLYVLWLPKQAYLQDLTGSFINRNHFAGVMALTMLLATAAAFTRLAEVPAARRAPFRARLQAFRVLVARPGWPWLAGAVLAFMAVLLSHSRAGLAVSLLGGIVLLALLMVKSKGARPFLVTLSMAAAGLALTLLAVMGGSTSARLGRLSEETTIRHTIYEAGTQMVTENPLWGTGVGGFEDALSAHLPATLAAMPVRITTAHNTWLEWLTDLGAPAFVALMLPVLVLLYLHMQGLLRRRRGAVYPALGLAVMATAGAHGLVDFTAQLPGVATFLAAVLGLTTAQSLSGAQTEPAAHTSALPYKILLAAVAVGLLVLVGVQGRAVAATWPVRHTLEALEDGTSVPTPALKQADNALTQALKAWPTPALYEQRALTRAALATRVTQPQLFLVLARQDLAAALRLAPGRSTTWFLLAQVSARQGMPQQAKQALINSLLTGPTAGTLLWQRLPLTASLWPLLNRDDQALACTPLRTAMGLDAARTAAAFSNQAALAACNLPTTPPQ